MSLLDKYAKLVQYAKTAGVQNFSAQEQNGILYITGGATSSTKTEIWNLYNAIDPDMRAGDLVLNLDEIPGGEEIYEVKKNENLSVIASKYPGMTWQKIFEANKDVLKSPDLIQPGQKLKIPR